MASEIVTAFRGESFFLSFFLSFFISFVLSFLLPGVKPAASVAYRPASRDPVSADVVRWYPE